MPFWFAMIVELLGQVLSNFIQFRFEYYGVLGVRNSFANLFDAFIVRQ